MSEFFPDETAATGSGRGTEPSRRAGRPVRMVARSIAAALVPDVPGRHGVGTTPVVEALESDVGIGLADIDDDLRQYEATYSLLEADELPFPCLVPRGHQPLPIAILADRLRPGWFGPDWYDIWLDELTMLFAQWPVEVETLQPDETRSAVRERVSNFVATRLRDVKIREELARDREGSLAPPPGLSFRVETDTSGLRVLYCPAIIVHQVRLFGTNLSTPVDGWLNPGVYCFGYSSRDGNGSVFDFSTEYEVPSDTFAHLYA